MRSNSFDTKLVKQTKGGGEGSAFVGKAAIWFILYLNCLPMISTGPIPISQMITDHCPWIIQIVDCLFVLNKKTWIEKCWSSTTILDKVPRHRVNPRHRPNGPAEMANAVLDRISTVLSFTRRVRFCSPDWFFPSTSENKNEWIKCMLFWSYPLKTTRNRCGIRSLPHSASQSWICKPKSSSWIEKWSILHNKWT